MNWRSWGVDIYGRVLVSMLYALMSQLPEDSVVIHSNEFINSTTDPTHSMLTEKCISFPIGDGKMPVDNNSYPTVPELHSTPNAEHTPDTYTPSEEEVDLSTTNEKNSSIGHDPEVLDQNHANGHTSGKTYHVPKKLESDNSFDSMVVMLDGVTTTMSYSQSSSTDRLSVTLSEGDDVSTTSDEGRVNDDNDDKITEVVNDVNGVVENGTSNDEVSVTNDENFEVGEDIHEVKIETPQKKSSSLDQMEFSVDTNASVEATSDVLTSDTSQPTRNESAENPENRREKPTEHSPAAENLDLDEDMEAVELSSTDSASEISKLDGDSSGRVSESNTASTLELKSSMSGIIGDQLVDSILQQMDDEDGADAVLRRKEMRPNSVRLSGMSLAGQGGAGCSTPVGRVSSFGGIGDDVDLDETQFVEINLQSGNSESKATNDRTASADSNSMSSYASKTSSRLGNFLARNFTLRKSREKDEVDPSSDVMGWKLFGRVPPKQAPQGGLKDILNEYKVKVSPRSIADKDLVVVRRSDKEVPSTTALILQPRPSGLPLKDPEEEQRHQMMYDEMVDAARKSEQKEVKLKKKQREQQIRHEEELLAAVRIWNTDILPYWETAKNSKRTQDLWWKGIPPSIRGKVWKLAIGNDLNVTSELYEICLVRATEKLKILRDVAAGSDTDSLSSFSTDATGNRESSVDLIQLDVSRTFPQLCIFQAGGPYHKLLQGLLGAYVCYRPDVGYVQGMSFLAAVLLLNMDDVSSFICFANLLNKPCEVAFFRLNENLMKAYFDTYQVFFKENLPKLYAHFEAQHITPDLYIIDWMYTLFAKSLPLDVASRVWDVFCRDGEEFLFRTALGILRLYEDILLHLDFIHLAQFLTRLPENISGVDLFHRIAQIRMTTSSNKSSFAHVFARNQSQ